VTEISGDTVTYCCINCKKSYTVKTEDYGVVIMKTTIPIGKVERLDEWEITYCQLCGRLKSWCECEHPQLTTKHAKIHRKRPCCPVYGPLYTMKEVFGSEPGEDE